MNRHFTKEDTQMANEKVLNCTVSGKHKSNHNVLLLHTQQNGHDGQYQVVIRIQDS